MAYQAGNDKYWSLSGGSVTDQCTDALELSLAADIDFNSGGRGYPKTVYVGTAGSIKFIPKKASADTYVTLKNFSGFLPFQVRAIASTSNGTTAADIVAGW